MTIPVTFPEAVDARCEIELLMRSLDASGGQGFGDQLKSFRRYVFQRDASWVLDADFVDVSAAILEGERKDDKVRLLRLFAYCSTRRDFSSLYANDRKVMTIMNYLRRFATLDVEEQKAAALFMCHASSHDRGRDYLLYLSGWVDSDGRETCNADITADAAVAAIKSPNPTLRSYGVALIHNLSLKESFRRYQENEDVLRGHKRLADLFVDELRKASSNSKATSTFPSELCQKTLDNFRKKD